MNLANLFIIPIILVSLIFRLRFAYLISLLLSLGVSTFIYARVPLPNILLAITIFNLTPLTMRLFTLRYQNSHLSLEQKRSQAQAAYERLRQERSGEEQLSSKLDDSVGQIAELYRITRRMSEALEFTEIFEILGKKLMENFQFKLARLALVDEEAGAPKIRKVWELKYGYSKASPVDAESADAEALRYAARAQKTGYLEGQQIIFAPLMSEGRFLGTLAVEGLAPRWLDTFSILANQFTLEFRRLRFYQKIQELAVTDGLTGCYVRRYFLERLTAELERSRKQHLRLAFLMLDIDHFKQCNDKFGHLTGDVVLNEVAGLVKTCVREIDLVARFGGEEFSVLLPDTDKLNGRVVAERIRYRVGSHQFHAYDEVIKCTVSTGVAGFPDDAVEVQGLIDKSDQALYRAKQAGRNRVEIF